MRTCCHAREGGGGDEAQVSHPKSEYCALILVANTVKSVATLIAEPRQSLSEVDRSVVTQVLCTIKACHKQGNVSVRCVART